MEASYAGFDRGPYIGCQIGIDELKEMGRHLMEAMSTLQQQLMTEEIISKNDGESSSDDQ